MPSCGERLVWIILEVLLQNNLSNKQKQGAPLLFSYYSFFFRALPCGGYPQTPSEGRPSDFSINPNPFFIRRGFEPLPKPLANRWQGDVIDYGQKPPSVKGFLYGSQSLCPFGASHGLFTSPLSPPLEKGLNGRRQQTPQKPHAGKGSKREAAKRPKASNGKRLNEPTTLNAGR